MAFDFYFYFPFKGDSYFFTVNIHGIMAKNTTDAKLKFKFS